jgi:hypothetical protein
MLYFSLAWIAYNLFKVHLCLDILLDADIFKNGSKSAVDFIVCICWMYHLGNASHIQLCKLRMFPYNKPCLFARLVKENTRIVQ